MATSIRLSGNQTRALQLRERAKLELETLKHLMQFNNLKQDQRFVIFNDGSWIRLKSVFGTDVVEIHGASQILELVPPVEFVVEEEIDTYETSQFVVVTMSNASRPGVFWVAWDLQRNQLADLSNYSLENPYFGNSATEFNVLNTKLQNAGFSTVPSTSTLSHEFDATSDYEGSSLNSFRFSKAVPAYTAYFGTFSETYPYCGTGYSHSGTLYDRMFHAQPTQRPGASVVDKYTSFYAARGYTINLKSSRGCPDQRIMRVAELKASTDISTDGSEIPLFDYIEAELDYGLYKADLTTFKSRLCEYKYNTLTAQSFSLSSYETDFTVNSVVGAGSIPYLPDVTSVNSVRLGTYSDIGFINICFAITQNPQWSITYNFRPEPSTSQYTLNTEFENPPFQKRNTVVSMFATSGTEKLKPLYSEDGIDELSQTYENSVFENALTSYINHVIENAAPDYPNPSLGITFWRKS